MNMELKNVNGVDIAVVSSGDAAITDAGSALEVVLSARRETGAERIAIDKRLVCEEFFVLSSGLAGEVLQKFVNYHVKAAIYGDFSRYTSKPLRDFIYESNKGRDVFFVATQEEALKKLSEAL